MIVMNDFPNIPEALAMLKTYLLIDYPEAYDYMKMFEIDDLIHLERHASLYY